MDTETFHERLNETSVGDVVTVEYESEQTGASKTRTGEVVEVDGPELRESVWAVTFQPDGRGAATTVEDDGTVKSSARFLGDVEDYRMGDD